MRAQISTAITFEFDRPEQTSIPTQLLEEIAYSSQPLSPAQKETLSNRLLPLPKPVTFFEGQKVTIKTGTDVDYINGRNYQRKEDPDQIFIIYRIERREDVCYDQIAVRLRKMDKETHTCKYWGPQLDLILALQPVEELFEETLQKSSPATATVETGWTPWNPFSEATPPELTDENHAFLLRLRNGSVLEYDPNIEELILGHNEDSPCVIFRTTTL